MASQAQRRDELKELELEAIQAMQSELNILQFKKFDLLFPDKGPLRAELYSKHMEFFAAGKTHMTRVLSGGNRVGKTEGCAYEVAAHVTGNYPAWWKGRVFDRQFSTLVAGTEGKKVRKTIQKKLLGWPGGPMGSGLIPKDQIVLSKCRLDKGTANLYESIFIRHRDGYENEINVLTYRAGREAFEGSDPELIWEDEEPPELIHNENVQRLMTTNGIILLSYTPLQGATFLTKQMIKRGNDPKDEQVWYGRIAWDDVPHITPAMIARYENEYPRYEMAARRYGIPKMGSGAIFKRPWKEVAVPPFQIPKWWPRFYGLDFGWRHPTAALWFAWDRDEDVMYAYSEHRVREATPSEHAIAILARGDWIRGACDTNASLEDGQKMMHKYQALGCKLVTANKAVHAGIEELNERLITDRLKFFNTLSMTQEEYETYHTDEKGKIYAVDDDLMSALRYGVMKGKQIARVQPARQSNTATLKPVKFSERALF